MTLDEIITYFKKTRRSAGGYVALCPAHKDHVRSLSIGYDADSEKVLLNCFAGCVTRDIVHAAGLTMRDLFNSELEDRIVNTYDYVDENGQLLYQVVRKEPKRFLQRKPNPDGTWNWSTKGVRRVLYHLPEVLQAKRDGRMILVVEGEKDVNRLRDHGFVATTNDGGANAWRQSHTELLKGAHVALIPDNDDAGREHVHAIADALYDVARSIRIATLDVDEKGDVSDWLDAGHTPDELKDIIRHARQYDPTRRSLIHPERVLSDEELHRERARIAEIERKAYWRGYHDAMQGHHRELWQALVDDGTIDRYQLGWCDEKQALTIPFFDNDGRLTNIEYRSPSDNSVDYETELATLLTVREDGNGPALVFDDALDALYASERTGLLEQTPLYGLAQLPIGHDTLTPLKDGAAIAILSASASDERRRALRERMRVAITPTAVSNLSDSELLMYLRQAE